MNWARDSEEMDQLSKMLVVDDSATMRKIIMRALRQAGFDLDSVLQASNGVEALHCLESNSAVGLILCDVNMPEMNGIELVRNIRKTHTAEALPIIMITTEGGDAMRNEAMSEGANGYISKPFKSETIVTTLEPYLG